MTSPSKTSARALLAGFAVATILITGCGGDALAEPAADPLADQPSDPDDEPDTDDGPVAEPATPVADEPAPEPPADPTPTDPAPSAPLADGEYQGRLVSIDSAEVTLDLVAVLSGADAVAAAKADGVTLDDDGTLPNDVYVQDLARTVTLPVAGDGGFQIYDCSAGCELVGTTLDALASGEAKPYGGANTLVTIQIEAGTVVSFVEQYLP